ncbi:hypothetical protein Tco_0930331 [Tanacetum coccineum]
MAISIISVSSDSLEESVGTSTCRVILFGTIPTTVPVTTPVDDSPVIHDDTLLIPTETPTIPPIAPTIQYTSPFIYTDSSDSDTPDTPLSPTHDIPPGEITPSTRQVLPAPSGAHRRRAVLVSLGRPITFGRPYRYHPIGPVHMLTARKMVGPLPTHRIALRYSEYYSSSYHFTSDDSSRDSSSDSSSKTSSDSHSDTSSDSSSRHSSSGHSISDSPCDPPTAISAGPSRKRRRSPTTSVPIASPIPGILSPVRADLLPPHKRIRDSNSTTDFKVS